MATTKKRRRRAPISSQGEWPSLEEFTRWAKKNRAGEANLIWPGLKLWIRFNHRDVYGKIKDL